MLIFLSTLGSNRAQKSVPDQTLFLTSIFCITCGTVHTRTLSSIKDKRLKSRMKRIARRIYTNIPECLKNECGYIYICDDKLAGSDKWPVQKYYIELQPTAGLEAL
ncbi:hypothetical protein L2E82_01094 [Cichorium intybus]|uniref:Uncharacterized protein n=1 Tax=Cichorium intybus TaxID=13427 RepID=A0ACB9GXN2_CICIN|nr:hypothetical protein L2E82_01094 [Cichorium intybus]